MTKTRSSTKKKVKSVSEIPALVVPKTCFRPLGNRIVVSRAVKQTTTKAGILLPTQAQEDATEGTVLAIGPGLVVDGVLEPIEGIAIGDTILFSKKAGEVIKCEGEEVLFIKAGEVIAVVNP